MSKRENPSSSTSNETPSVEFGNLIRSYYVKSVVKHQKSEGGRRVRKKIEPTFTAEIRSMMYIHGDVEEPLWESAITVEKAIREQINQLLEKATDASETLQMKRHKEIGHEEILFVLKENKVKLRRLLMYLSNKDTQELIIKRNYKKIKSMIDHPEKGKRLKQCLGFLKTQLTSSEMAAIMDRSYQDAAITLRNQIQYAITKSMGDKEYLYYSEKRMISFFPRGGERAFKEWVHSDNVTNLKTTKLSLEIINFFAKEIVADIVTLSLVSRRGLLAALDWKRQNFAADIPQPMTTTTPISDNDDHEPQSGSFDDAAADEPDREQLRRSADAESRLLNVDENVVEEIERTMLSSQPLTPEDIQESLRILFFNHSFSRFKNPSHYYNYDLLCC